ncbi:hypothetical protein AGMMS49525_10360 [Bacteroidia bacterium]|nr:hypothetical protein AGMMS49525_10360 [Bacteroidia bacterium]
METTVNERVRLFIDYKKLSIREFERMCGLSNGYVNGITQTIMPNKVHAISLRFPELSTGWLMTGEGQMLKTESQAANEISIGRDNSGIVGSNAGRDINYNNSDKLQENKVDKNNGVVGIQGNGHTINNGHNVQMGNNSLFNPADLSNLTDMLKDKDFIIAKLRKQIEEKDKNCVNMLSEKDKFIQSIITDRDAIVKNMMDREQDIVKNSYERNKENLDRMDKMNERIKELQDKIFELIDKAN